MILTELKPEGDRAKQSLTLAHTDDGVFIASPCAEQSGANIDWYNDRPQILVHDGQFDDPALHVRLNPDGSIAEILVRDDLIGKVHVECGHNSQWQKERDGE